ncbi:hypothetical protein D3C72_2237160 [compost metagenome]
MSQVQTNQAQRRGDEERNTPAPVEEVGFPNNAGNQHYNAGTQHEAGNRAEIKPTAHKATLAVR